MILLTVSRHHQGKISVNRLSGRIFPDLELSFSLIRFLQGEEEEASALQSIVSAVEKQTQRQIT